MKYTVDRIENNAAVLEPYGEGEIKNVGISLLHDGVKEGDMVMFDGDVYTFLADDTKTRENDIRERFSKLSRRKCGEGRD